MSETARTPSAAIRRMIGLVQEGRWIRDFRRRKNARGTLCFCALGMVDEVTNYTNTIEGVDIVRILDRAIPESDKKILRTRSTNDMINGGTIRGTQSHSSRVASFNNTVMGEDEIIAWYERALELAAEEELSLA